MLPEDASAAVIVISMGAHTAIAALADGFDVLFEDVHAQVDAGMVYVHKCRNYNEENIAASNYNSQDANLLLSYGYNVMG